MTQNSNVFKKTDKQKEAIRLLTSNTKNIMLYGGSRSGKTLILCYAILVRAAKTKSRHAILRQKFNHAKRSIWLDTLKKTISIAFPNLKPKENNTDLYLKLANGSEVWVGGLDDEKNVEKILGNEYSTIYFNECSQIEYSSIQIARTRLAEKNILKKKTYYDQNPPTKSHWSYWLFEKKIDPIDEVPLENPEDYASMIMNPQDNIENIDEEYLNLLSKMPEKERNRFLLGLYNDESDGQVYYAFRREQHVTNIEKDIGTIFIGMDFNVDPMTATIIQYLDNCIYVLDEVYLNNSDTFKMTEALKQKGYSGALIIPDSTGANRKTSGHSDFKILQDAGFKIVPTRNPFVMDRVNNVNRLFSNNKIFIDPKCKKLINDLEKVSWKDNKLDQSGENKHLTHISDSLGYACWHLDTFHKSTAKVEFQTQGRRR